MEDCEIIGHAPSLMMFSGQNEFSTFRTLSSVRKLFDNFCRYWSHVVNCKSCNIAYKGLNTLEVVLQVISIISIGIVAATKQGVMSMVARTTVVSVAIICFAASRWLAHFIYKNFHFHDYNHAFR